MEIMSRKGVLKWRGRMALQRKYVEDSQEDRIWGQGRRSKRGQERRQRGRVKR